MTVRGASVGVSEGVAVSSGVGVFASVGDSEGVNVRVGMSVDVFVDVAVSVGVGVSVDATVGVAVGEDVDVIVLVGVGVDNNSPTIGRLHPIVIISNSENKVYFFHMISSPDKHNTKNPISAFLFMDGLLTI